jgi:hypothetical protein
MDYSNLCQRVMDLDPGIRFAGICDNTGENVYGGQRVGVKNILSNAKYFILSFSPLFFAMVYPSHAFDNAFLVCTTVQMKER